MLGRAAPGLCSAILVLLVSLAQLSRAGRSLAEAGKQEDLRWSGMATSLRAQAHACYAQLEQLAAAKDPSAFSSGSPPGTWEAADERRKKVLAELAQWHAEHNTTELLPEGHVGQISLQQQLYLALAQIPCVKVVCEIGFNAGHSAAVWMAARDDIHLVSFDLGNHPYAFTALQFYSTNFPGRITATFGNSMKTVPFLATKMAHTCDVLVVDGGHDYSTAIADIENMAHLARPAFNIFVIDDVNCRSEYCQGPVQAVQEAINKQLLSLLMQYAIAPNGTQVPAMYADAVRGFSFGSYHLGHHHQEAAP